MIKGGGVGDGESTNEIVYIYKNYILGGLAGKKTKE
jgi:hypothetical protein